MGESRKRRHSPARRGKPHRRSWATATRLRSSRARSSPPCSAPSAVTTKTPRPTLSSHRRERMRGLQDDPMAQRNAHSRWPTVADGGRRCQTVSARTQELTRGCSVYSLCTLRRSCTPLAPRSCAYMYHSFAFAASLFQALGDRCLKRTYLHAPPGCRNQEAGRWSQACRGSERCPYSIDAMGTYPYLVLTVARG